MNNAASVNTAVSGVMSKIVGAIVVPIVTFIFALAVVLFVWGAAGLILHRDSPDKRKDSWNHILWGLIGMFIMISAYGIIRFIANTIGVAAPF